MTETAATDPRPPVKRRAKWRRGAAVAVAFLLAGLSLWSLARTPDRATEAEVARAFREGRRSDALAQVDGWQKRSPRSADAALWSARLALADRRMKEAAEALARAQTLGASRPALDRVRAIAMALGGKGIEAEPTLRQAFNDTSTHDPLLDEALAKVYLELYDLHRAGVALKRWMADAPNDPTPYLRRAEIDTRIGDPAAAINDYREALKRNPRSDRACFGLAEGLRLSHKNTEAAEAYTAYLNLKPDDPAGQIGAGRNAAEMGENELALRFLKRATELAPDDPLGHRLLAEHLIRQGDFPVALDHLDRAVKLDPYDLEAHHTRGMALARVGRVDEAKADQAAAARLRADLESLMTAQNTLVRAPRDLDAQLTITRWMFAHGKAAEGVRWAERVLVDRPAQPDACRLLADHYTHSGQTGLANFYRAQAGPAKTEPRTPPPTPGSTASPTG